MDNLNGEGESIIWFGWFHKKASISNNEMNDDNNSLSSKNVFKLIGNKLGFTNHERFGVLTTYSFSYYASSTSASSSNCLASLSFAIDKPQELGVLLSE